MNTASARFRCAEAPPLFRPHTTKKGCGCDRGERMTPKPRPLLATECTLFSQQAPVRLVNSALPPFCHTFEDHTLDQVAHPTILCGGVRRRLALIL